MSPLNWRQLGVKKKRETFHERNDLNYCQASNEVLFIFPKAANVLFYSLVTAWMAIRIGQLGHYQAAVTLP